MRAIWLRQPALSVRVLFAIVIALATGAGVGGQQPRHGRLFPPEDLGVLEGPDRDAWQMPDAVMDALGIADGTSVADIGAGGGWFTVRLARRVGPNGVVYAQDVQSQMIEAIRRRVDREGLKNVRTIKGDELDPRLPARSVDAILIVDAYQEFRNRVGLMRHFEAALTAGGRIGVIGFTKDGAGPGPDERLDAQVVVREAEAAGLRLLRKETFLPFQYFLIFGSSAAPAQTRQTPQSGQDGRRETQLDHVGRDKRIQPRP
jgi:ubiquinone/menaquinone biosynthesis C-methylase UbiE